MAQRKRRGFTIVELVIVIAVIAILAGVLIPTFISVINKANVASDTSLVKNINEALIAEEVTEGKPATMYEALQRAEANGFTIEKLTPRSTGDIVWNSESNRFALVDGDKTVYSFNGEEIVPSAKIWKIVDSAADVAKNTLYSSYIKGATTVDSLTVKMGVDVGENTVTALTLETSGNDTYAVRTNSAATTLTVKAPSAVVEHYDEVGTVNVVQVAMNSYHEHGSVQGNINLAQGKVALEAGSSVSNVVVKAIDNVTPTSQGVKVVVEESAEANLVISEVSGVSVPVEGNGAANVDKVEDIAGKVATIGSATYATLSEALTAAKDGDVVTLLADSALNSSGVINKDITVDLNGTKLTTSVTFTINQAHNAVFKNGTVVNTTEGATIGFHILSNAGLSLVNIDYSGACYAVYPAKDASSVNIVNSYIHDVLAGVATNARGDLSNNVKVIIESSVIDCGQIAVWINVPGSLSINDSVLKGGYQALMVRGGTAVVTNSELVLRSGTSGVAVNDSQYLSGNEVWSSGNAVPIGALIVGDYSNGYSYTASCTLKNTKISTNITGWTRELIVLAQDGAQETIFNFDAACNISSSDYLICNYPLTNVKKGQITVNGTVVQTREQ